MNQPITASTIDEQTRLSRETLKEILDKYKPSIVLTFGVAAFLTSILASGETPSVFANSAKLLGEQFRSRIEKFHDDQTNIIPLLHASIARGKFLEAHRDFVGAYGQVPPNYFDYVGTKLADLLLAKLSDKPIWIE
jgi:hypothetical protein